MSRKLVSAVNHTLTQRGAGGDDGPFAWFGDRFQEANLEAVFHGLAVEPSANIIGSLVRQIGEQYRETTPSAPPPQNGTGASHRRRRQAAGQTRMCRTSRDPFGAARVNWLAVALLARQPTRLELVGVCDHRAGRLRLVTVVVLARPVPR